MPHNKKKGNHNYKNVFETIVWNAIPYFIDDMYN